MVYRSKNDFYDLDRQIEANRVGMFRKMNVALRKARGEFNVKLRNPFEKETERESTPRSRFSQ